MKFAATLAVAASAMAVASAQNIAFHNPGPSTIWKVGQPVFLAWTGTCASMGNASHAVAVELVNGSELTVGFVADLGKLDCSNTSTVRYEFKVPETVQPGKYSIRAMTIPQNSYTDQFTIQSAAGPAPPASTTTPPAAVATSAAGMVAASSMVAMAGMAIAALQYVL